MAHNAADGYMEIDRRNGHAATVFAVDTILSLDRADFVAVGFSNAAHGCVIGTKRAAISVKDTSRLNTA